jgi:hypothetical protein|tara:strand:+ start:21 stop:269 length:249 start_codon:yes stop_codon:yes gene_type:complete
MGFHKRRVDNDQVIRLYEDGGVQRIIDWYTKGVDAIMTEAGLATEVSSVLSNNDWIIMGILTQEKEIIKLIQKHLGIIDTKK